jgi:[FeFe] hydrogenase (group B1/B3)
MAFVNNTMIVRRVLISRLVKLWKENKMIESIDRIPLEMSPKHGTAKGRCCIHKERAVIKYKMLPILGFGIDQEEDELKPLSAYASEALTPRAQNPRILTVVDEACTSCVKVNYVVSNLCRGCVARSCALNCPKGAIAYRENGQASIDHTKCISCGICKEACPYHSIVYIPIPCEEACPVKAISKDENGIEKIDETKCIYCGKCINACPFGSIYEVSKVFDVLTAIRDGQKLVAIPAPALMSQYNNPIVDIFEAIKSIGFHAVEEVAHGAMVTTRNEGEELREKLEEGQQFMTTSCCPAYTELVNKHVPEMKPFVSTTKSPMYYTAEIVRQKYPDAKVVFIGPCVAKRKEMFNNKSVDYVWTFEELDSVFEGLGIEITPSGDGASCCDAPKPGKGFARSGGVAAAVQGMFPDVSIKPVLVANIDKKNVALLRAFAKGKAPGNFIEVMACEDGCITGPSGKIDGSKSRRIFQKAMEDIKD